MTTLEEKRRKERRIKTTIEKAIEILNHHQITLKTLDDHDFFDALNLGIEALKRCQRQRIELYPLHIGLLPGETPAPDYQPDPRD